MLLCSEMIFGVSDLQKSSVTYITMLLAGQKKRYLLSFIHKDFVSVVY